MLPTLSSRWLCYYICPANDNFKSYIQKNDDHDFFLDTLGAIPQNTMIDTHMLKSPQNERLFVLLLAGPAGAGKTTTARAWASAQQRPTAHISLDDVRDFVKSGYADPSDGWETAIQQQYHLARQGCATLALNYVNAGFLCIIDDAIFPQWAEVSYQGWHELLREVPHYLVVLLPKFEYLVERNQSRSGHRLLSEAMLRTIYDMMLPWHDQHAFPIIDNSELSIEETVASLQSEVDKLIKNG
jgi:chloramphenicol 3-O-phosphotransferase